MSACGLVHGLAAVRTHARGHGRGHAAGHTRGHAHTVAGPGADAPGVGDLDLGVEDLG